MGRLEEILQRRYDIPEWASAACLLRGGWRLFFGVWLAFFMLSNCCFRMGFDSYGVGFPFAYVDMDFRFFDLYWEPLAYSLAAQGVGAYFVAAAWLFARNGVVEARKRFGWVARMLAFMRGEEGDHVRRFGDLAREMVWARLLGGLAVGFALAGLAYVGDVPWLIAQAADNGKWVAFIPVGIGCTVPTFIAKKGWRLRFAVLGVVVLAYVSAAVGTMGVPNAADITTYVLRFGVVGAAVALAEGLAERSIATAFCGMLGGMLSGTWAGLVFAAFCLGQVPQSYQVLKGLPFPAVSEGLWSSGWSPTGIFLAFVVPLVVLHLGIGLSLAVGRRLRDHHKTAESPEG